MRAGESLRPMTQDELRRILLETGPDFSAELCASATINDLDRSAVESFLSRWDRESGKTARPRASIQQRLEDAELVSDGKVTYAAFLMSGPPSVPPN
ncbi:MAG TPA: hypothetical protein VN633_05240 [Bryobacteraceae bacterium]|nr:hypothetical protein [Bryobacteraceae bacterium]